MYQVNEPAPTDEYFSTILNELSALSAQNLTKRGVMRRYLGQWSHWLKLGLSTIEEFEHRVRALLPSLAPYWGQGAKAWALR